MTQEEHDKMLAIECLQLAQAAPRPTGKALLTEMAEARARREGGATEAVTSLASYRRS